MSIPPLSRPDLKQAGVARRTEALFKALTSDYLLREQFVTDPAHIYFEFVHGTKATPEHAEATNHLIYAVLCSSPLLHWYHDYLRRHLEKPPEPAVFLKDFTRAVVTSKGEYVVAALLRSALEGHTILGFGREFPFFDLKDGVLSKGMLCGGISVTPDTGPTTQSTDTGHTTQSTDTGHTTQSTDTGTTTQSTDTGSTTQSTDTGSTTQSTETGPGEFRFTGDDIWSQPLNSLADYARHLRAIGALNVGY